MTATRLPGFNSEIDNHLAGLRVERSDHVRERGDPLAAKSAVMNSL